MQNETASNDTAKSAKIEGQPLPEDQRATINVSQLVTLCAAGLIFAFFLPWIDMLIGKPSGFDFAKEGNEAAFLWILPLFCVVTITASVTKSSMRLAAQITGCLPFLFLIVGLAQMGADLIKALASGSYLGLILGFALLILPKDLK